MRFSPVPVCHQGIAQIQQPVKMVGTGQQDKTGNGNRSDNSVWSGIKKTARATIPPIR